MDTIGYYNKYASAIFEQTVEQDMEEQRKTFTEYLEEGDTILDLGCGSGRDSLAFYEQGFDVTPLAYEDMEFDEVFDGVWGNEALIHVPEDEIDSVMERVIEALCQGGILYLSFQEGDFEGIQNGRYFCQYTQEKLERLLKETGRLEIQKIWVTDGNGHDEDEHLIHVLAKKIS